MERNISLGGKLENYLSEYRNWSVWKTIIVGQICSVIVCILAFLSHHFTTKINLNIPTGQSYLHYILLCSIFTTWLACRKGEKGLISVAKARGCRYILVGFLDVQANTLLATSYQFTTIVSIQLLDCVAIPIALALSCLTLGVRFRFVHILGVSVCLMGVGCLVWADIGAAKVEGQLVGDMLCLGGAVLFAVVVVLQELAVKTLDCIEYLGMLGLCGSIICGLQMYILERNTLMEVNWEDKTILIYLGGFAIFQFLLYSLLPYVLKNSGATALQLFLLTSDFYTLVVAMVLYKFKFHALYFLSFLLTMCGIYIFSIKKAPISAQQTTTTEAESMPQERPTSLITVSDEQNNSSNITREYLAPFVTERFELIATIPVTSTTSSELLLNSNVSTGFSSFYGS